MLMLLIAAVAAAFAQSASAPQATWPRYDDPAFAVLAPVDALGNTAPPRDVVAALDRLQPQLAAASPMVQARAALIRGLALRRLADLPAAERAATEARTLAVRVGHPFIEFDALILLNNLASDRGDLDSAAARLTDAVPVADRTGDDGMRFNVRLEQGRLARARGRGASALAPLTEALDIATRLGALRMRVQALGSRSTTRLGLADYDGALADAQLAYDLTTGPTVAGDVRGAAAFALAQTLSQVGDLERGLDLWTDAIDAYTNANFLVGVSLATRQRMDTRFALEDYDEAAADGERARDLFARTGSAGQEPALLSRLALIEAIRGRRDQALAYMKEAAAKGPPAQPRVRTQVEGDLALVALKTGDLAEATTRFTRMLEQAQALRDADLEWRAQYGLGRAALGRADLAAAQSAFEAAIALIERVRQTLPEAGLRADFVAERLGPYDGLIATLVARSTRPGDPWIARAFETAERARGRALAELLSEAEARLTDPAVATVRQREAEFGERLSGLQRSLAAAPEADRPRLVADLDRAEREYDAFVVRIRRETPQYAALTHPHIATAAEVAQGLSAQDALVCFWAGATGGQAWVVTRDGLRSYALPPRRDLDREVARLNSAITAGQIDLGRQIGTALAATLFKSVDFSRTRRLVIVPDGPLWRAPFAALATGRDSWLIQQTSVSVVPSASLYDTLRSPAAGTSTTSSARIFAIEAVPASVRTLRALYDERLLPDRPLSYAPAEAQAVARAAAVDPRTAVFLNDRADETTFRQTAATPARVVHVASHAIIDDRSPRRSALILAASRQDDGLLQLNEIANLRLNADLVVLSTCQSQLGRAVRGEGLVSLSRAFILSGARAVTASLWAVNDRETSHLMPLFYAAMHNGAAPDEALRQAQLQMLRAGGADAAPASWAGFVLMGRATTPLWK
jgi:CHAT domain-containing protein